MAENVEYQAPPHPLSKDDNIIKYQISPENDLQQLAYELKGYVYNPSKDEYEKPKGAKGLVDEEDANKILSLVAPIMRKQWTLSNMEQPRILVLTRKLWIDVFGLLFVSGKYDTYKCVHVTSMVIHYALPNMMRAKDGYTAENIIKNIQVRQIDERMRKEKDSMFNFFGGNKKNEY